MTCDHKFIDTNYCAKCGWLFNRPATATPPPSYPDDVVAVMRDTITALREQVAELRRGNEQLRSQAEALRATLDASPLPEGM